MRKSKKTSPIKNPNNTLKTIQKNESIYIKVLSKVIHRHKIDAIMDILELAIASYVGLLLGSSLMLVSVIISTLISTIYGYEYRALYIFEAFAFGYILGILFEIRSRFKDRF